MLYCFPIKDGYQTRGNFITS